MSLAFFAPLSMEAGRHTPAEKTPSWQTIDNLEHGT